MRVKRRGVFFQRTCRKHQRVLYLLSITFFSGKFILLYDCGLPRKYLRQGVKGLHRQLIMFKPFIYNVEKWPAIAWILRYDNRKIFKVYLAMFQHNAWKDSKILLPSRILEKLKFNLPAIHSRFKMRRLLSLLCRRLLNSKKKTSIHET